MGALRRTGVAIAIALTVGGSVACDPPPPPVVLSVTSVVDAPDASPGDGVCEATTGAGDCTLRAAVDEAGAVRVDRIDLPFGTYDLGAPLVADPAAALHLQGAPGAKIRGDAGGAALLDVRGPVTLSELVVKGSAGDGVAVRSGASLVVVRSSIHRNAGAGIALEADATALVSASTLSTNGVGLRNQGTAVLSFATVADNETAGLTGASPTLVQASIVVGNRSDAAAPACTVHVVAQGPNGLGGGCYPALGRPPGVVPAGPTAVDPLSGSRIPVHEIAGSGSPLHWALPEGTDPCASGIVDQYRSVRGRCDLGAKEYGTGADPSLKSGVLVDRASDAHAADPATGCDDGNGDCTLRGAVEDRSPSLFPPIRIADGIDPTLGLGAMVLDGGWGCEADAGRNVDIRGNGASIDATGQTFVFHVGCSQLHMEDVTVTGAGTGGTVITVSGGGQVVLDRVTIARNGGAAVSEGGDASTTIVRSRLSENARAGVERGLNTGRLTISSSTIDGNGAGLSSYESDPWQGGTSVIEDSVIAGNGVGIEGLWRNLAIKRSLIEGNGVGVRGDGVELSDSTLSGNGVGVQADASTATSLLRSTLVGTGPGIHVQSGASVDLGATVVQGGLPCVLEASSAISSRGRNAVGDGSCALTGDGDLPGVDARLGPLADNGGPTWTHLPAAGSPVIDMVVPDATLGLCAMGATDQRGIARPVGPACDAGAAEQ